MIARKSALFLFAFLFCMPCFATNTPPKPLSRSDVLALIAGNALPENIVHVLGERGLDFRPDDTYRSLLKTAGADAKVLAALEGAKVVSPESPAATSSDQERLEHISKAASLMKDKHLDEAAREMQAYNSASFGGAEVGFVMGELFRNQGQWDAAVAVYIQVLTEDPSFPEAHTKLSYIRYRTGDYEESLREAEAAIEKNSANPEAHKNAGLALESMRKFDAGEKEYREAIRIKPDYEFVYFDLANLLREKGSLDDAIIEYNKALVLNSRDIGALTNLGITFVTKGDFDSAIREFREAKRQDPNDFGARANLADALSRRGMYAAAVQESRELEKMFPNAQICHLCLGSTLYTTRDFAGAEQELDLAAEMDPSDPLPHVLLGLIREEQKEYDEALGEYHKAEQLDDSNSDAHADAGRVLLAKKDFTAALSELQRAENLNPSGYSVHDLYGRALAASGDGKTAIDEFKQSLALDPKQIQVMLDLADALEKSGDWVAAIDEYRKASQVDASIDLRGRIFRSTDRDPQREYDAAKERLNQHLVSLKASGESTEAADLETRIQASQVNPSISEQLDAAMQAAAKAMSEKRFDETQRDYKEAVALGEKLQPHDPRLVTALDNLGKTYLGQDFAAADAAFGRELQVAEELVGPQSPFLSAPLQSLGTSALFQKNYASAEKFYFRAVELNETAFGEGSDQVASSLLPAASVFIAQREYDKAEPYLLRALNIDEALYGDDSIGLVIPLNSVCYLYDQWDKPDKSEPCQRHMLAILEKQYGPNSPVLASTLTSEAKALRSLGRNDEAAQVDARLATIRAAMTKLN
jgi:tetratricopeptide (TPR) repeat protein